MKIVEFSVKRPIGVLMIVIAVMALGAVSLRSLAIDLFPKIDLPIAAVATSYPGAAPEEIEKLITEPLESSLSSLQGIDMLQSQSQPSSSLIILQFKTGTDLNNALMEVREKVDQTKGFLPANANDPMVLRFDPQQMPVVTLGLSGLAAERLQALADDVIVPYLERQDGVASVTVQGGKTREILVELDQAKLSRYGVTASQVVQALRSENQSAPVGTVDKGVGDLQLSVKGEFTSVNDIGRALIHLPTGGHITVDEVAEVRDTFAEVTSLSFVNGSEALVLSVQKQSDANTVNMAGEVRKALVNLEKDLPAGVKLDTIMDTSTFIQQSINSVVNNMISGAVLAVLILLLFLRSARSTLVIGLSIPIAVISTFTLMYFTGQTLNIISMGGLALGIGMMVDSSIVILENIFTYREKGLPMKEAAMKGASELGSAVIASTVTTVVVFLPIVFVEGLASDLFMPMAMTVSFALVASLIAAMTLIPMLSSQLISPLGEKKKKKRFAFLDRGFDKILSVYRAMLKGVLRFKKTTLLATFAAFIGSCALIPFIGMEFMPAGDQGQIQITVEAPAGTKMEELLPITEQVSDLLTPYSDVIETAYATVGGGGGFGGSGNTASYTVILIGSTQREISTTTIVQDIARRSADIAGAEITVSEVQGGLAGGSPIQIKINGPDQEVLNDLADQVIWTISNVEGVFNAEKSSSEGNAELNIVVDRNTAAFYGLSYQQIVGEIQLSMEGQTATQYREGGDEFDVKVTLPADQRSDLAALTSLRLTTPTGQSVPLSAVAELVEVQGPVMIQRENQQRQINVTSDIVGRDLGSVSAEVQAAIATMNMPDGYSFATGGQSEDMMKSFVDLGLALVFSILLVYIVMAVQFESLLFPFVVMFAMPPTLIGILFGLFITNTPLSITALIGVIILAGIVVNNAIVLVDYINILRSRGLSREEAIIEAGPSRVRAILMTTLTTVLGLVPLALGIGEGAEMQAPMAIVVIFGLSFSTLITLLLVPVMYVYADKFVNGMKRLFRRKEAPVSTDAPEATVQG